jgi:hypothetical protein
MKTIEKINFQLFEMLDETVANPRDSFDAWKTCFDPMASFDFLLEHGIQFLVVVDVHLLSNANLLLLTKLTPEVDFTFIFTRSFYVSRSQKHSNSVKLSVSFCAFGIGARKSYS